jgi:micrococcal nuclease
MVRRAVWLIAAAVLVGGPLAACGDGGSGPGPPDDARRGTVVETVDGDTITLAGVGRARLIGVDTPEVSGGVECYGREAAAFTRRALPPGTAVRYTLGDEARDRYGRPLVYVWLADGRFFNAMLAREGFATPLTIPPNVEHAGLFARLAREARRAGRGLWSDRACGGAAGRGRDSSGWIRTSDLTIMSGAL